MPRCVSKSKKQTVSVKSKESPECKVPGWDDVYERNSMDALRMDNSGTASTKYGYVWRLIGWEWKYDKEKKIKYMVPIQQLASTYHVCREVIVCEDFTTEV